MLPSAWVESVIICHLPSFTSGAARGEAGSTDCHSLGQPRCNGRSYKLRLKATAKAQLGVGRAPLPPDSAPAPGLRDSPRGLHPSLTGVGGLRCVASARAGVGIDLAIRVHKHQVVLHIRFVLYHCPHHPRCWVVASRHVQLDLQGSGRDRDGRGTAFVLWGGRCSTHSQLVGPPSKGQPCNTRPAHKSPPAAEDNLLPGWARAPRWLPRQSVKTGTGSPRQRSRSRASASPTG